MIKVKCNICGTEFSKSPSKVCPRNYCSRSCQFKECGKFLAEAGKKTRFSVGNKRPKEWTIKQTEKVSGEKNYAWKGESVSFHGLHMWLRREKGHPNTCTKCGKFSTNHYQIQWANIDGKYKRDLSDYVAMCTSCHKNYDIAMAKTRKNLKVPS